MPETFAQIYAEALRYKGHGYPLWKPEPRIEVGDVGYVDEAEGCFVQLFNALKKDTEQDTTLPAKFTPLTIDQRNMMSYDTYLAPGTLTSTTITTMGWNFTASTGNPENMINNMITGGDGNGNNGNSNEQTEGPSYERKFGERSSGKGASLTTEFHSRQDEVRTTIPTINYIKRNHSSWYHLARGTNRGVSRTSVSFIQSTVKSPQYMASVWTGKSKGPLGGSDEEKGGDQKNQNEKKSESTSTCETKRGERRDCTEYCLFVQQLKVKYRLFGLLGKKIEAGAGPHELPRGDNGMGDVPKILAETATSDDPLDVLLDYILECSNADFAIGSDATVKKLFDANPKLAPTELHTYLRTHRPIIAVDEDGAGYLSIEVDEEPPIKTASANANSIVVNSNLENPYKESVRSNLMLCKTRSTQRQAAGRARCQVAWTSAYRAQLGWAPQCRSALTHHPTDLMLLPTAFVQ